MTMLSGQRIQHSYSTAKKGGDCFHMPAQTLWKGSSWGDARTCGHQMWGEKSVSQTPAGCRTGQNTHGWGECRVPEISCPAPRGFLRGRLTSTKSMKCSARQIILHEGRVGRATCGNRLGIFPVAPLLPRSNSNSALKHPLGET